jgi:hypothetical protein
MPNDITRPKEFQGKSSLKPEPKQRISIDGRFAARLKILQA